MTTAARSKAKPDEWDALLETASLTDRDTKKRPTIDVPEKIVKFAQSLYDQRKAATFPVDSDDAFARQKSMWQSAGDLTNPPTSATIKPVTEPGPSGAADDVKVVGLRVSFGERRGQKGGKDKPQESVTDTTND